MSFVNRFRNAAVVGVAATALLLVGQPAGAVPAQQVTVTPSTGLADGAAVSVLATGFPPGEAAYVAQCGSTDGQAVVCDLDGAVEVVTGPNGQASTVLTVHRAFEGYDLNGEVVEINCATAPGGCAVAVATASSVGATAAISFR